MINKYGNPPIGEFNDVSLHLKKLSGDSILSAKEILDLACVLKISKEQEGPILLHVLTKKGKGYKPAEENPDIFHSTSKFDILTGEKIGKSKFDYSKIFGEKLFRLEAMIIVFTWHAATNGTKKNLVGVV